METVGHTPSLLSQLEKADRLSSSSHAASGHATTVAGPNDDNIVLRSQELDRLGYPWESFAPLDIHLRLKLGLVFRLRPTGFACTHVKGWDLLGCGLILVKPVDAVPVHEDVRV